jgi:hypothetical protein
MDMSKRQLLDQHLEEKDIYWVLTVPAIWKDVAKQFMREAAENVSFYLMCIFMKYLKKGDLPKALKTIASH